MILLGAAVGCNLAVPAVILGGAQCLSSHLSKTCVVAGTRLHPTDWLRALYWAKVRRRHVMTALFDANGDCWQARHGKGLFVPEANVNIECAADQDELQQMPTIEGEGCAAFCLLHWLWPQTLRQRFTLSFLAADLLAGSSFDNVTSFVGLECRITNGKYLLLLCICPVHVR